MSQLAAAALRYRGVPFRHLGRTERALDCAGLAWIAHRDCGVVLPDFRRYGREPHNDGLIKHITVALGDPVAVAPVSLDRLFAGDVVVMRFKVDPHHVAIVTDYPYGGLALVHACGEVKRVVWHRLAPDQVKRITHVFRKPI